MGEKGRIFTYQYVTGDSPASLCKHLTCFISFLFMTQTHVLLTPFYPMVKLKPGVTLKRVEYHKVRKNQIWDLNPLLSDFEITALHQREEHSR